MLVSIFDTFFIWTSHLRDKLLILKCLYFVGCQDSLVGQVIHFEVSCFIGCPDLLCCNVSSTGRQL